MDETSARVRRWADSGIARDDGGPVRAERRRSGDHPRPSQGPVRTVLRRDVGALFLLRDARPAHLLSDEALALFRRPRLADLRRLYLAGLYHPGARRLAGRPLPGAAQ